MKQIINGVRYDTEKAELVADDKYWDGHNWDRKGRNKSLYKTKKGNFFIFNESRWQGEFNEIESISKDEAKSYYEDLIERKVEWEEAFEGKPEEA